MPSVAKDVKQLELSSYTANENVNWYSYFGKTAWQLLLLILV